MKTLSNFDTTKYEQKVIDILLRLLYNLLHSNMGENALRVVLQRVLDASVEVEDNIVGQIGRGFVVFLGISQSDNEKELEYLVKKVCGLRIFEDENEKMNLSPSQVGAEILVISNFTLYANTTRGFRPDFLESMRPEGAKKLVDKFVDACKMSGSFKKVQTGIFGADMKVRVTNDGPITIIIDSKENGK